MKDTQLDALMDEVDGKPGLGIEDSAGLFDFDDEPWPLQPNERMAISDRDFGSIEDDYDFIRHGGA